MKQNYQEYQFGAPFALLGASLGGHLLTGAMLGGLALLLALLPLSLTLPLLLLGGLAMLALIDPVFGLYAVVLSVPIQEQVLLPGGLTYTQACMAIALGTWALRVLSQPAQPLRLSGLLAPWALLIWVLLLSAAFTPYALGAGLAEVSRWGVALLAFVLTLNTVRGQWRALVLIGCLLTAPLATAAFGLLQFVSADGPPSFALAGGRFVRAYGTFGTPNTFAGYLNMAWPLALALLIWVGSGFWQRRTAGLGALTLGLAATLGLLGAGLLASFSRGAWLGALAAGLAMIALAGRRAAVLTGLAVVLGGVVIAAGELDVLPEVVRGRVLSIGENLRIFDAGQVRITSENFAIVERMAHWQAALRMVLDRPLLGIGTGNFNQAYAYFFVDPWRESRGHAHNYYLHIAAESGSLGLSAYLALLVAVFGLGISAVRRARPGFWKAVSYGACGIMAAVAGHNVFENLHVLNMGIQLSATWGLLSLAALHGGNQGSGGGVCDI